MQPINGQINNRTRIARADPAAVSRVHAVAGDRLSGRWESYRVFFAPVNWRFRSGDRFELNANPDGERLVEPFEIAAVSSSPSARTTGCDIASRGRRKSAGCTRRSRGGSATSTTEPLNQIIWTGAWNPTPLVTVEFSGERNVGHLAPEIHANAGRHAAAREFLTRPVDRQLRAIRHG